MLVHVFNGLNASILLYESVHVWAFRYVPGLLPRIAAMSFKSIAFPFEPLDNVLRVSVYIPNAVTPVFCSDLPGPNLYRG